MSSRIFLVDDEPVLRSLYRRVLADEGYQVVGEGEAGPSLLGDVLESEPDIVLLDLTMPGGSGLDYVGALTTAGIAVVVISGGAEGAWRRTSFELGAVDVLVKPVEMTQLTGTVARVLNGSERVPKSPG